MFNFFLKIFYFLFGKRKALTPHEEFLKISEENKKQILAMNERMAKSKKKEDEERAKQEKLEEKQYQKLLKEFKNELIGKLLEEYHKKTILINSIVDDVQVAKYGQADLHDKVVDEIRKEIGLHIAIKKDSSMTYFTASAKEIADLLNNKEKNNSSINISVYR